CGHAAGCSHLCGALCPHPGMGHRPAPGPGSGRGRAAAAPCGTGGKAGMSTGERGCLLMQFEKIDRETWTRREYFEHYFGAVPCTYSMTVKLDITPILESGRKLYPSLLYYL